MADCRQPDCVTARAAVPASNNRERSRYQMPMQPAYRPDCGMDKNDKYPVGMAYVPWTRWEETYDVHKALMTGTIFPSLDKPWCGMRGGRG